MNISRIWQKKNNITSKAAEALLEQLLKEPMVSEEVERLVFSDETSPELKGYYAGEEKGFQRGHEVGLAKGIAISLLGMAGITAAGIAAYLKLQED